MEFALSVLVLALLQYTFFSARCGFKRVEYRVAAPKTVGHDEWERFYRVQMNTLELLVVFIPAILLFAHFVSDMWAGLLGILFIFGRGLYSRRYIRSPESRGPGMAISMLANMVLLIGGLFALIF